MKNKPVDWKYAASDTMLNLTNTNNITSQHLQYNDKHQIGYFTITQNIPHRINDAVLETLSLAVW